MCRRQSKQGADRGAVDPEARPALGGELLSAAGEQPVQGVDPRDHRVTFDPCDGWLRDPGPRGECPLREARAPPRVPKGPRCVHQGMITKKVSGGKGAVL